MNRRSFLRASLAAGAGLAIAPGVLSAEGRSIKLGVIGTGSRGTGLIQTLLLFKQVELRAVCDVVRSRAGRAAGLIENRTGRAPEIYADTEAAWEALVRRPDLDGVIIATPWEWHARMAIGAMQSGKCPGVEVPAAITSKECHDLVKTSEKTGVPCMMLENVCYYRNVMSLLRMIRAGLFGELAHCEAGYQHDCRALMFESDGKLTWRGRHSAALNGNQYPTHSLGPAAQWLGINRGDRFVSISSVSSAAYGLREYAAARFGAQHEAAQRSYRQGDVNTSILRTDRGRTVTLYFNLSTYRPYDLIQRVEGVRGIYLGTTNSICLQKEGAAETWEPFAPYEDKYEHPMWKELGQAASKSGGHGGAEYLMFTDYLKSVEQRKPAPQDVYDAAAWSAIFPLSCESVAKGGRQLSFPDFTRGGWKNREAIG
jgi:predicted dehydrogenase